MSELLTPMQAARVAGVSYPTMKQWIYKGKIHTTKTAGGHYRIARAEIERVTGRRDPKPKEESRLVWMRLADETSYTDQSRISATKVYWSR